MWDAEVAKKIDHSMKTWGQDQFPNWLARVNLGDNLKISKIF